MDFQGMTLMAAGGPSTSLAHQMLDHMVPYVILLVNYLLFKLLRNLINRTTVPATLISSDHQPNISTGKTRLLRLFIDELISTCELCADCAELNVVYEKHGSYAYGLALFILSYLWIDAFGEAHTSPGYLAEEYFLIEGNGLLKTGDAYARFIGQSLAMPLAWRLASVYWRYQLISEHRAGMANTENCKSSLTTSTLNGFLIELACCLLCRLAELIGHKLLERRRLSQRVVSVACAFVSALLVVLALESSGGYFHPILAASLEYGCKGIEFHQHALVFWLGPLLGHLLARGIFRKFEGAAGQQPKAVTMTTAAERRKQIIHEAAGRRDNQPMSITNQQQAQSKRVTRSNSQRKKKTD